MEAAHDTPAWVLLAYLVSGICFILALRGLSSPASSRRGNRAGMIGMAIAVVTTLAVHEIASLAGNPRRDRDRRRHRPRHRPQDPDDGDAAAGRGLSQPCRHGGGAGRCGGLFEPGAFGILGRGRHPSGQPDRNGPRRRDRRDHLLGLGDRLPEAQRQHERQADPACRGATSSISARSPRSSASSPISRRISSPGCSSPSWRSASPSASC